MDFTVNTAEFKKNLKIVLSAISKKPTHPILLNVKIEQDEDTLILTGFNLDLAITAVIQGEGSVQNSITLPAKELDSVISRIKTNTIDIKSEASEDEETVFCTITADEKKATIQGIPVLEYPEIPTIDETNEFSIPLDVLERGINFTEPVSSNDITKQLLTGVNIQIKDNIFNFASTDGHRLSQYQFIADNKSKSDEFDEIIDRIKKNNIDKIDEIIDSFDSQELDELDCDELDENESENDDDDDDELDENESEDYDDELDENESEDYDDDDDESNKLKEVTFPSESLKVLSNIIKEVVVEDNNVLFSYSNNYFSVSIGNFVVLSRILQGTYPNYPTLIPSAFKREMEVNRERFSDSVQFVGSLGQIQNPMLEIEADHILEYLTLSLFSKEVGQSSDMIPIIDSKSDKENLKPIKIGFNVKYFEQGLNLFKNFKQIFFCMNEPSQPAIIRQTKYIENDIENYIHLMMPVQLK